MQRFFSSLSSIETFTHALDTLPADNACQHCSQNDQWVSHGFIRKVRRGQATATVGKRLFCSNRHNRRGCGKTRQLYIANHIPRMRHKAIQVISFMTQLLAGLWVEDAYREAVGECEARQAWRWLSRLEARLGYFRTLVKHPLLACEHGHMERTKRLSLLLEPWRQ